MSRLDYRNPYKHPGSGTTNPFAGGEDWHPLTNVEWIPETRTVVVERPTGRRERVPADGFVGWVKEVLGMAERRYRDQVVREVRQYVTHKKHYLR